MEMSCRPATSPGEGWSVLDSGYLRPGLAASYLLAVGGRGAVVEVPTAHLVPRLLEELDRLGVPRESVDFVFVTHVHLDHASGAGRLMAALPRAKLVVHPRGARHMVDPSRLVASATKVYGAAFMNRHCGDIAAVAEDRVVPAEDGMRVEVGGRVIEAMHTPGHAKHHMTLWDLDLNAVFSGDALGVSYPELEGKHGRFLLPSTSPVQFDPDTMAASVTSIMERSPRALCLTHFGVIRDPETRLVTDSLVLLDRFTTLASQMPPQGRVGRMFDSLLSECLGDLDRLGCACGPEEVRRVLELDLTVNAQGLDHWQTRREH